MLLINKKSILLSFLINYKLLHSIKTQKNLKKKLSHTVILRAPKNFNIGKLKIKNYNYKFFKGIYTPRVTLSTFFFCTNSVILNYLSKCAHLNMLAGINSYQVTTNTVFKLVIN